MLKFVSTARYLGIHTGEYVNIDKCSTATRQGQTQSDTRVLLQSHEAANTGSSRCDDECLPDIVCAALGVVQEKEADWKNPQLCEREQK